MDTTRKTLIDDEIATLTGKVYAGDVTPMAYELLKDTGDINALLSYLTGEVSVDANNKQPDTIIREEGCHRPSVEEWLRNCEQLQ